MVKAILFDLDDTLLWDKKSVDTAFRKTCELAGEKYEVDPAELENKVREQARSLYASYDTYSFTQMIGINPFEGLWADFSDPGEDFHNLHELAPVYRKQSWTRGLREAGVDDPKFGAELAETFPVMRKENAFVYQDTFSVLNQLKDDYELLLLTNGAPSLQETKLNLTPALKGYFDAIVISGAFGRGKPDVSIFEHAVGQLKASMDELLMVGDNLQTDILGASRAGIASVWINRDGKVAENVQPTHEIRNLEELLPLLESLKKR
ncbi:HAD family hydrolase [Virgibacillus ihumii]|uniref:HAD family hydrolase n=1 Tax=Virgibacillus ihumii TaxID=2686091 RepID=UPI00157CBCAA|nr:HAD family hydrolase [Virgibacillus ihumii]